MRSSGLKSDPLGYLFILPNYLIYLIFIMVPVIIVVYLSFTEYELITPPVFIGMKNYVKIFSNDTFLKALKNTLVYWVFTVLVSMMLGLLFAVLLRKPIPGSGVFRAIFYLPNMLSLVATAIIWLWLYNPGKGALNSVLLALGYPPSDWLLDRSLALWLVIIPSIWTMLGYSMIIYLAGLQGIPEMYYEAATIDGAGYIRQFISITLPMLRPITFFIFIMTSIKSFQVFDQIYIMTRGGPVKATTTIAFEIYENGFHFYNMGYAAAMSVILLLLIATVTLVNFQFGREGYNK